MAVKRTYLVAGGTGAIGSGVMDLLLQDESVDRVYATCRSSRVQHHRKLKWLHLDYQKPETICALASLLCREIESLAGFVCATGELYGDWGQPEKTITSWDADAAEQVFRTNALGPLQLFARCSPLLKRSKDPVALFLTAQIGSIEDNAVGGWISYRMSKAALNMGVKTAAIEAGRWCNGAAVVAVHPGTTQSMLSAPFVRNRKNVSSASETAKRVCRLIGCLSAEDNGTFITSRGKILPW